MTGGQRPGLPPTLPAATVRQMFGQVASRYDLLNHLLSCNLDRFWRRALVRAAGRTQAPRRLLDVCCGTGDVGLAFARPPAAATTVVGLDFSTEMLELGAAKVRRRGTARITFVTGDALELPFLDQSFDLVTVAFGIRNVERPAEGLREVLRVLRPGGEALVLEFAVPRGALVRALYMTYFRRILPILGRLVSQAKMDAYRYLPLSVEAFPSHEAFLSLLREAGFDAVCAQPLSCGAVMLYRARRPRTRGEEAA
ncbi:MAG: bifunctional demethylmenaquinone methyltransferase/2-methoxy-6-polyprenyl-1,4-benzoquinol methylase UbiE [Planctomycetota bacterium]